MRVKIPRQAWLWYGVAVVIIGLDQLSKAVASHHLIYAEPVLLATFFNFTLLHNHGAAFSFLSESSGWQRWLLAVIAVVVSAALVVWIARSVKARTRKFHPEAFALAFMLGGALGNLVDRITLGYVVDFIVVHYYRYYFPAFNLADSAITLGAVILIFDMFLTKEKKSHA